MARIISFDWDSEIINPEMVYTKGVRKLNAKYNLPANGTTTLGVPWPTTANTRTFGNGNVDLVTGIITTVGGGTMWAASPNTGIQVKLTGTVTGTGLSTSAIYYLGAISGNTCALYTSQWDAEAGTTTGRVIPTGQPSATITITDGIAPFVMVVEDNTYTNGSTGIADGTNPLSASEQADVVDVASVPGASIRRPWPGSTINIVVNNAPSPMEPWFHPFAPVEEITLLFGDSIAATTYNSGGTVYDVNRRAEWWLTYGTDKAVIQNRRWGWTRRSMVISSAQGSWYVLNSTPAAVQASTERTFTDAGVNTTTDVITTSGGGTMWAADDRTTDQAPTMVRFTTTGTLPAPLDANTTYFIGAISGNSFRVYANRRDAKRQLNHINLTTAGSGSSSVVEIFGSSNLDMDWFYANWRNPVGIPRINVVFESSSNDITYYSGKAVCGAAGATGTGTLAADHFLPTLNKAKTIFGTDSNVKYFWGKPIARGNTTQLNNRMLDMGTWLDTNATSLGLVVVDTHNITIGGTKIFDPATPSNTANTTYYLGDTVHIIEAGGDALYGNNGYRGAINAAWGLANL